MALLGDESQVVARFSLFGDSVMLTQDRGMVCTEHTIGSEIIFDARNGTHVCHVESRFGPFGDSVSVTAR